MGKKEKICGVYKITSPNNRVYIGSSINIQNRFYFYKNGSIKSQWLLKRSFQKYGVTNHKFEIVEICMPEDRLSRECYWGEFYKSLSDYGGLNLALPKIGDKVYSYSEITRNKMSEIAKKRKHSEQTRKKQSDLKKEYFKNNIHHRGKLLINLETGIFYNTIKEAAKTIGLTRTGLTVKLLGYGKNNTQFRYA